MDAHGLDAGLIRVVNADPDAAPYNPAAIEGQSQGATAQGLAWALLESMLYDRAGQLLAATFMSITSEAVRHTLGEEPQSAT